MSQENVELARRYWALWSTGSGDEIARQLAPDVEWHHNVALGTPLEGTYTGRKEVLELSAAMRLVRCGACRSRGRARPLLHRSPGLGSLHLEGRGSGAAVTTPFGAVTEIVDGLAVRQRFWTDQSQALEAAGLRE